MKSLIRKIFLGLLAIVLLTTFAILSWWAFRTATRRSFDSSGGTILVYEVDVDQFPDGKLPESYQSKDMADAMLRRLDPTGSSGIVVQPSGDIRMEIRIPSGGDHAAAVEQAKNLLARAGKLEFRVLANMRDDTEAIEVARDYFGVINDPQLRDAVRDGRRQELEDRGMRGLPPPAPARQDGTSQFEWKTEWGTGQSSYAWVELAPQERKSLDLDNAARDDPRRNQRWELVAKAREQGRPVVLEEFGRAYLYSRPCVNRKLSPAQRDGLQFDYFILTRDPGPDARITGQYLNQARESVDRMERPAVHFTFNPKGGDLFYDLTKKNRPSGGEERFHRHIAIILDDVILSSPRLNEAIRTEGQIAGNFTQSEVRNIVTVLRAGALPVPLKPLPVSETVVTRLER